MHIHKPPEANLFSSKGQKQYTFCAQSSPPYRNHMATPLLPSQILLKIFILKTPTYHCLIKHSTSLVYG